jgi:hypothetical protein
LRELLPDQLFFEILVILGFTLPRGSTQDSTVGRGTTCVDCFHRHSNLQVFGCYLGIHHSQSATMGKVSDSRDTGGIAAQPE